MIGLQAQLACIWEATARKAGNVHRQRDFADLTYLDFLQSAAAIAPVLDMARKRKLGETVLACVQATRSVTRTNTNLGMILLLAPLAAVPDETELRPGVVALLSACGVDDSRLVGEAIRLAQPGGLGTVPEQDVRTPLTLPLQQVMALAAERDLVARQYANNFPDVFDAGVPTLLRNLDTLYSLEAAIVRTHLHLMALFPDTLISRKLGPEAAAESARRARLVLDADWPHRSEGHERFAEFDAWLCDTRHQRNPGATADLVTACLFVLLREGKLRLPLPWPF